MVANSELNPNKFIDGNDGLYKVKGFDEYKHEKEVIGLGDIKVSKILWAKSNTNHDIQHSDISLD